VRQEGDGRPTERAGEVQHRGVDRYEEIDLHEGRCGIGEVAEEAGKIGDGPGHASATDVRSAVAFLQGD
jgi:hypothetical protein